MNATTSITVPVTNDDPYQPVTVQPGTPMTISAQGLTFFSRSPVSNALPATQG